MSVLKFTLAILSIAGCWRPVSWTSSIKHILYDAYTLLIISLMYSFIFMQFMDVILNADNPEDFTNVLYIMLALIAASYKIFYLWVNHESFAELIQNLTEGTFKPLVSIEFEIRRKFDKMVQNYAMCYFIMIMATVAGHIVMSLLTIFRKRQLAFKGWVPYDYSSFVIYCFTFTHQYVGVTCGCMVNIGCDSLIVGLLLHLCCQITILQYRLKGLINGQNTLSDCVRQHHHIIEYAHEINQRFTKIVAFQFIMSTFLVCSNLFHLTKITFNANFILLFVYTLCVLVEIFIYCWFGNELKLTSLQVVDCIFEIEWITLDNKTKRSLLIIINRAMRPIEFNSAHILNINLDSFVALLKASYSTYNLLSQIQE